MPEPLPPLPPMASIAYETPNLPPDLDFPEQRGGMKVMGLILVMIGAFSGCFAVVTPLSLLFIRSMPGGQSVMTRDVVGASAVYGFVAFALITAGVGSFRVRRWSRPVILILSATWVLMGINVLLSWLLLGPSFQQAFQAGANVAAANAAGPPGATSGPTTAPTTMVFTPIAPATIGVVAVAMVVLLFVLLPGGYFWFYVRDSVRRTLDYFDHSPAWTDRCPTPVLALSGWLAVTALFVLNFCLWGVFPLFGRLISGAPAIAALMATAVVIAGLAVGVFRLRGWAWWGTAVLLVAYAASSVITFSRVDPLDIYRLSGTPAETITMLEDMNVNTGSASYVTTVVYALAGLAYLIWIRRYFRRAESTPTQPSPALQTV